MSSKVEFFLERASLGNNKEALTGLLTDFFSDTSESRHVIFKRSIMYFYESESIVNTFACDTTDSEANVYTFDGHKVSRLKPEYYVGSDLEWSASSEIELFSSNNNNNNNNNNNGNNNG